MKIAVLGGGGAMGGMFGGYLARAGEDVVLIDVSNEAVEAINGRGVVVEAKDGSIATIPVRASSNPSSIGPVDLIINFVKCYSTEAAIRSAAAAARRKHAILTLQNGWGNADRIAAIAAASRVMVGLTYNSGTLLAPGRIKHSGIGMTVVGELDGSASPRGWKRGRGVSARGHRDDGVAAHRRRDLEEARAQCLHASDGRAAALSRA
jgi:2-dehydropantoate 2-reductase